MELFDPMEVEPVKKEVNEIFEEAKQLFMWKSNYFKFYFYKWVSSITFLDLKLTKINQSNKLKKIKYDVTLIRLGSMILYINIYPPQSGKSQLLNSWMIIAYISMKKKETNWNIRQYLRNSKNWCLNSLTPWFKILESRNNN